MGTGCGLREGGGGQLTDCPLTLYFSRNWTRYGCNPLSSPVWDRPRFFVAIVFLYLADLWVSGCLTLQKPHNTSVSIPSQHITVSTGSSFRRSSAGKGKRAFQRRRPIDYSTTSLSSPQSHLPPIICFSLYDGGKRTSYRKL
ncbi:hypothetical protein Ddc_06885 [Ditylenchus destructor]|nr:hypothetical protein Ddc_06885 [Ditylenchus destructor]